MMMRYVFKSFSPLVCLYSGGSNTEHVRFLNGKGLFWFWMVRFSNDRPFWIKKIVISLGHFINMKKSFIKWPRLFKKIKWRTIRTPNFQPFKNRIFKYSEFECIRYSNIQNSSPHCTVGFWIPDCSHVKKVSPIGNIQGIWNLDSKDVFLVRILNGVHNLDCFPMVRQVMFLYSF